MFMLALLAIGIAVVPLFGGQLLRLASLRFRGLWVLQAAVLTQILIIYVLHGQGSAPAQRGVHLGTYAAAAVFVWLNRELPGMRTLGLGGLANVLAIITNGGVMPTLPQAATLAGFSHATDGFQNSAVTADTPLWFLGDVFAIPAGLPLANVFSVGDVLLLAAGLAMVWAVTGVRLPRLTGGLRVASSAA